MKTDSVRRYMKSRGVSDQLVAAGLPGTVARWASIAKAVDGYDFNLDDWLNDMDVRDIIAGALEVASEKERKSIGRALEQADEHFRRATVETGPIWGSAVAASHSHEPERTWWYFRRPKNPGETLKADLKSAGLV